jgi:diadenosine tetraphosphatase ApaH/serine/threonine PP2A family protein phosphatase
LIYGVIGDIHSNYEALTAVVNELRGEHVDKILCTGDIIGYAAEPIPCIDVIRALNCTVVAGNHDYAAVGKFPASYFHADARTAIIWTAQQLSTEYIDFLKNLPLVEELNDNITLVHASLNHPEFFDYITTGPEAQLNFDILKTQICFYGHTHVPLAIFLERGGIRVDRGGVFDVSNVDKVLINVGSVGQPRDWDIRASYAIYDDKKKVVQIRRVKYNIHGAVNKIYRAGLPVVNALRLMG